MVDDFRPRRARILPEDCKRPAAFLRSLNLQPELVIIRVLFDYQLSLDLRLLDALGQFFDGKLFLLMDFCDLLNVFILELDDFRFGLALVIDHLLLVLEGLLFGLQGGCF